MIASQSVLEDCVNSVSVSTYQIICIKVSVPHMCCYSDRWILSEVSLHVKCFLTTEKPFILLHLTYPSLFLKQLFQLSLFTGKLQLQILTSRQKALIVLQGKDKKREAGNADEYDIGHVQYLANFNNKETLIKGLYLKYNPVFFIFDLLLHFFIQALDLIVVCCCFSVWIKYRCDNLQCTLNHIHIPI